jgi:hypothetical protein
MKIQKYKYKNYKIKFHALYIRIKNIKNKTRNISKYIL